MRVTAVRPSVVIVVAERSYGRATRFVGQQPAQRALDHPAVPAQTRAGVPADASDPGGDAAPAQIAADPRHVVALVAVQLERPAPRVPTAATADRRHGVQDRLDEHAVVAVGAGDGDVER